MNVKQALSLCCCIGLVTACSDTGENAEGETTAVCKVYFSRQQTCRIADYTVDLQVDKALGGERLLKSLNVVYMNKNQVLDITAETYLPYGYSGYILAEDINFDGRPDLAVTTSFGTPNLYLDYWVFDTATTAFIYIGNYSKFQLDANSQTLHTRDKISASNYREQDYKWEGNKLVQLNR